MNLDKIRMFISAAEHLNFTKAAEDMYISQPTLSRHISDLEDTLGIELFKRTTRNVSLTPAGEQFLIEAQDIMRRYDSLMERVSGLGEGVSGTFSIGYLELFIPEHLPRIIQEFRRKYPMVELDIKASSLYGVNQELTNNKIDAGFVLNYIGQAKNPELDYLPLISGQMVVVVGRSHALAGYDVIDPVKLKGERIFMFKRMRTPGLWEGINRIFMDAGISPDIVEKDFTPYEITLMIRSGLGIAILNHLSVNALDVGKDLHVIRLNCPPITAYLELAWRRDAQNPFIENFANITRNVLLQ